MPPARREKVLLLIPHLGGGGAEQVIASLACKLNPDRYEIHLGLVTQSAETASEQIPSWVTVHRLGARRVRSASGRLLRLIWLLRPAVVLSGIAHLNLLVLMLRPLLPRGVRLCVRQNGALSATLAAGTHPFLASPIYAAAYRRADRVVCQTESMARELRAELAIDSARLVVLPNPVDLHGIRSAVRETNCCCSPGPRLLAVSRLSPEKGIDLLLQAFAGVRLVFATAALEIFGGGPCKAALEEQRDRLKLEKSVHFHGNVTCPADHFGGISAFVLPSRHEGLPNALLEAAAAGLPLVALPASDGMVELLRGRPGIWIAKEISAPALEAVLLEALRSVQPGERFAHAWVEAFDVRNAIPAYEDMIEAVLQEGRS